MNVFFSIWVFFLKYSWITGLQGKGEVISLTPLYHFHPLYRQLDISRAILHFHVFLFYALECLWSEFDVSEIFWLSLAAVKVSSWKFNSRPSADPLSSTNSAGSFSACCSVFSRISPLSNPDSMDSVAGEPTRFCYRYKKGLQRFYFPHFFGLCWESSYNWHEFALFLKQYYFL